MIAKEAIKDKIEPFIYDKLNRSYYEVNDINPIRLLTWNRLDLAFKIFYLQHKDRAPSLAIDIYKHDVRSQTLGSFEEYGNDGKSNFQKYLKEFEIILENIQLHGFDSNKTVIPLSSQSTIINGAHRTASAIFLGKKVVSVKTDIDAMTCDYRYFYERSVPESVLDIVAQTFIEYANDTYIAFLWPSGDYRKQEVLNKFSNVVYHKKIKLTPQGGLNLLIELYKHMDWVGNQTSGFGGAKQKLIECFPSFSPFDVVVFQSDSIDKVRAIKDEVRQIYNIGFSSIHITDTKEEAIKAAKMVLNNNSIHFLNYAEPNKYYSTYKKIEKFKRFISENGLDSEDVILDGGMVLSAYGLRESSDIDYFLNDEKLSHCDKNLDCHDDSLKYHNKEKSQLIYDPENYFYFNDLKLVSFNQIYRMKKNRNEEKDKNDCAMMESLIEDNKHKQLAAKIKQYFLYSRIKLSRGTRGFAVEVLKKLRLYEAVRHLYRKARNRK